MFDYLLLAQIDHRRAYNCEIMLSKVKVPLHDLMVRWFISVYLSMKLRKKNASTIQSSLLLVMVLKE